MTNSEEKSATIKVKTVIVTTVKEWLFLLWHRRIGMNNYGKSQVVSSESRKTIHNLYVWRNQSKVLMYP